MLTISAVYKIKIKFRDELTTFLTLCSKLTYIMYNKGDENIIYRRHHEMCVESVMSPSILWQSLTQRHVEMLLLSSCSERKQYQLSDTENIICHSNMPATLLCVTAMCRNICQLSNIWHSNGYVSSCIVSDVMTV